VFILGYYLPLDTAHARDTRIQLSFKVSASSLLIKAPSHDILGVPVSQNVITQ
jgi:hypothetical protein